MYDIRNLYASQDRWKWYGSKENNPWEKLIIFLYHYRWEVFLVSMINLCVMTWKYVRKWFMKSNSEFKNCNGLRESFNVFKGMILRNLPILLDSKVQVNSMILFRRHVIDSFNNSGCVLESSSSNRPNSRVTNYFRQSGYRIQVSSQAEKVWLQFET